MKRAIYFKTKKKQKKNAQYCGVSHRPTWLSEAECNPLTKRASLATLDAQRTATELRRDPYK